MHFKIAFTSSLKDVPFYIAFENKSSSSCPSAAKNSTAIIADKGKISFVVTISRILTIGRNAFSSLFIQEQRLLFSCSSQWLLWICSWIVDKYYTPAEQVWSKLGLFNVQANGQIVLEQLGLQGRGLSPSHFLRWLIENKNKNFAQVFDING